MNERLKWAVTGPELSALGLESAQELFAPTPALSARLEILDPSPRRARFRFPLPGTPDARGNLVGRPGPLGTGWLWLTVFRGTLRELLRARSTHPRSPSLAEREWNLLCHLRANGVGTCEPLLVGARGAGIVSAHSFLLVRAPEDALPLPRWLRTAGGGAERQRGLRSLGQTLALLLRSGVELPGLCAEHLLLTPGGAGECEAHEQGGPRRNKLPGVTIVDVRGGRILRGATPTRSLPAGWLAGLEGALTSEERAEIERLALARPRLGDPPGEGAPIQGS